jgi:hypothetical protein
MQVFSSEEGVYLPAQGEKETTLTQCNHVRCNRPLFVPGMTKQSCSNAALEEKIESLVNLISAAQGITSTSDQLTPPVSQPRSEASPSSPNQQPDEATAKQSDLSWAGVSQSCRSAWQLEAVRLEQQLSAVAAPPQPSDSISHLLHDNHSDSRNAVQAHDPRCLLNVYREQFAPHFPFIGIPDGVSAEDLRSSKPWLYRTVLMVAAQEERLRQQELGKQIVSDIASAMLLRGEKSLDMLQSLCVCNLWLVVNLGEFLWRCEDKSTDLEQGLLLRIHHTCKPVDGHVPAGSCITI